jgi:hypothetical protein
MWRPEEETGFRLPNISHFNNFEYLSMIFFRYIFENICIRHLPKYRRIKPQQYLRNEMSFLDWWARMRRK